MALKKVATQKVAQAVPSSPLLPLPVTKPTSATASKGDKKRQAQVEEKHLKEETKIKKQKLSNGEEKKKIKKEGMAEKQPTFKYSEHDKAKSTKRNRDSAAGKAKKSMKKEVKKEGKRNNNRQYFAKRAKQLYPALDDIDLIQEALIDSVKEKMDN